MTDQKEPSATESATPRTDTEATRFTGGDYMADYVPITFARQLERELAAAQREIAAQKVFEASYQKVRADLERELAALRKRMEDADVTPHCFIIGTPDDCDVNGFISANVIEGGEFHVPLYKHSQSAAIAKRDAEIAELKGFNFHAHLRRQREWSERTFGPGERSQGVVDHIRKELIEIETAPLDLIEWIDVAILALDGAWRAGHSPDDIIAALVEKQTKNEGRKWPDWRTAEPGKAIEHIKDDAARKESSNG